jgi:polysaccharide export outer membrane protein
MEETMLKRSLILCLGVILAAFCAGAAWAQEDYRVGPEDKIEIRVWGHDDLTREVRVGLDGLISFPFAGEVKAKGLSLAELQKELQRRLGPKYIIDPHVSIKVLEYKSQKFFVVGNVHKPGTYPLTKPIRVIEAISQAGGVVTAAGGTAVSGDVAIIVRAPGGKADQPLMPDQAQADNKITVSLTSALAGDPKNNLVIKNGDTIFVPSLSYYVSGEVKKPGRYPYEGNLTVLMAVTTAGGLTDKAAPKRTEILREKDGKKEKIKVSMEDLIRPGDTIVVPESWF